jgi:uncharacterized Fe-S cluster-containing radical SAM superfamily protein
VKAGTQLDHVLYLRGDTAGQDFCLALRSTLGDGDELYRAVMALLGREDSDEELRGFLHQVQKRIAR